MPFVVLELKLAVDGDLTQVSQLALSVDSQKVATDDVLFPIGGRRSVAIEGRSTSTVSFVARLTFVDQSTLTGEVSFLMSQLQGDAEFEIAVGERTVTCSIEVEHDPKFRLADELDEPVQDDEVDMMVDSSLDVPSGNSRTQSHSSVNQEWRFLCQPGRYSGDCWHIAGALLLDPSIQVCVLRPPRIARMLRLTNFQPPKQLLFWELELRSSFGVNIFVDAENFQDNDWTFHHEGTVEFWVTAWAFAEGVENTVVQYQGSIGTIPTGSPSQVNVQLPAVWRMSASTYLTGAGDYEPAPDHPLACSIQYAPIALQTTPGAVLSYPETFVVSSLRAKLRGPAETTCLQLVTGLDLTPCPALQPTPEQRLALRTAMIEDLAGAPRRLFVTHDVTLDTKIRGRMTNQLSKWLLQFPMQTVSLDHHRAILDANHARLQRAAQELAKAYSKLVIPDKKSQKVTSDYILKSNQFLDFYGDCGVYDRVLVHNETDSLWRKGQQAFAELRRYVTSLDREHPPLCGMTFCATSVLMNAVEQRGLRAVRERLIEGFTATLDNPTKAIIEQKLVRFMNGGPWLFVNMREGGYHPEHDVTPGIYQQLKRFARRHWLSLVRVGGRRNYDPDTEYLDIYPTFGPYVAKEVDLRHTAYLWRCVAQRNNIVGMVGGMSGSLDIAAYMGVRCLCWDIAIADHDITLLNKAELTDRVRLRLSFPFMSIVIRRLAGLVSKAGALRDDSNVIDVLEPTALEIWMSGHDVIPPKEELDCISAKRSNNESSAAFKANLLYDLKKIRKLLA